MSGLVSRCARKYPAMTVIPRQPFESRSVDQKLVQPEELGKMTSAVLWLSLHLTSHLEILRHVRPFMHPFS